MEFVENIFEFKLADNDYIYGAKKITDFEDMFEIFGDHVYAIYNVRDVKKYIDEGSWILIK